jgi:hypothetical protein
VVLVSCRRQYAIKTALNRAIFNPCAVSHTAYVKPMKDSLMSQTLRRSLADWSDADAASCRVAVALGVAPDPGDKWQGWGGRQWLFWSANPLGEGLLAVLELLAASGVLEKNENKLMFRWNPEFDWKTPGTGQKKRSKV